MKLDIVKIEIAMAEQGLTQKVLAERSGVSRQNISTIIYRGSCKPSTAGKLAVGLGVNVEEIIEKES